eukprot:scaffold2373_cov239-Pinguiococcus_pyrenoidosus.AAC.1
MHGHDIIVRERSIEGQHGQGFAAAPSQPNFLAGRGGFHGIGQRGDATARGDDVATCLLVAQGGQGVRGVAARLHRSVVQQLDQLLANLEADAFPLAVLRDLLGERHAVLLLGGELRQGPHHFLVPLDVLRAGLEPKQLDEARDGHLLHVHAEAGNQLRWRRRHDPLLRGQHRRRLSARRGVDPFLHRPVHGHEVAHVPGPSLRLDHIHGLAVFADAVRVHRDHEADVRERRRVHAAPLGRLRLQLHPARQRLAEHRIDVLRKAVGSVLADAEVGYGLQLKDRRLRQRLHQDPRLLRLRALHGRAEARLHGRCLGRLRDNLLRLVRGDARVGLGLADHERRHELCAPVGHHASEGRLRLLEVLSIRGAHGLLLLLLLDVELVAEGVEVHCGGHRSSKDRASAAASGGHRADSERRAGGIPARKVSLSS